MDEKTEFRLNQLEADRTTLFEKVNGLIASQASMVTSQEHLFLQIGELKGGIAGITTAIEAIKAKPGLRWNTLVNAIITLLAAAALAYFIGGAS